MSIFVDSCDYASIYTFPFINFGPWIIKGGFISTLARKVFAIELTDDWKFAYFLIDERINDEKFYWANLYEFDDK